MLYESQSATGAHRTLIVKAGPIIRNVYMIREMRRNDGTWKLLVAVCACVPPGTSWRQQSGRGRGAPDRVNSGLPHALAEVCLRARVMARASWATIPCIATSNLTIEHFARGFRRGRVVHCST